MKLHKRNISNGVCNCKMELCKYFVLGKQCCVHFMIGKHKYVHYVLSGPTKWVSNDGSKYFLTFIDNFYCNIWVYFLK